MTVTARAEFRVFGHGIIEIVQSHMWNGRTVLGEMRRMPAETYILSRALGHANVKVRDAVLDVKVRQGDTFEGHQIFQPAAKFSFPLTPEHLAAVSAYLGITMTGPVHAAMSFEEFHARAASHPDLSLVKVEKERFGFSIDDAICEYARVYFNGALIESACVESEHYETITGVVEGLGLAGFANTNYIEAASRVVGLRRQK